MHTYAHSIMSKLAQYSSSRTVSFSRSGTQITCGGTYNPGETLTISISNTANRFLFEVSGGASISGGSCSATRIDLSDSSVVMPSSGTVTAKAGWASGKSTVYITADCSLTPAPSTNSPTKAPTLPSPPTTYPTSSPTKPPTKSPTKAPTKSPTLFPSRSPLPAGVTYSPSKAPTKSPTKSTTVAPTILPTPPPPTDDSVPGGGASFVSVSSFTFVLGLLISLLLALSYEVM